MLQYPRNPMTKNPFSTRLLTLLAIITLIYVLLLRFYQLGAAPLWMDEGFSINTAVKILENGIGVKNDPTFDKSFSLHSLFLALGGWIFGQTEFGFRFFPALFGAGTVVISFLLPKKLFPQKPFIAYFTAFFLTFSTWEIAWSHQARMYTQLQFFFLLALFFLFEFQQTTKNESLFCFGLTFFAAFLSHKIGLVLLPIAALVILFTNQPNRKTYLTTAVIILIGISLLLRNPTFLHPTNNLHFYIRFLVNSHLYLILLAAAGSTITIIKEKSLKTPLVFLIIAIIIPFLAIAFFAPLINYRYLFIIFPLVVIVAGLFFAISFQNKKSRPFTIILLALFLTFSGELTFLPPEKHLLESDPLEKYPDEYRIYVPQPNFKTAHQFIAENRKEDTVIISVYPEITNFYLGKTDFYLPFDLENQIEWEDLKLRQYTETPIILTLTDLHKTVSTGHGFIVYDEYARQKLPAEVTGYIEFNTEKVFEKIDNQDSTVFVFAF